MKLLIDYGSIVAFAIVCAGTILQIKKTIHRKTVADISITEVLLRFLAGVLLWIKMVTTDDWYLIVGEATWVVIYFCYCVLVVVLGWIESRSIKEVAMCGSSHGQTASGCIDVRKKARRICPNCQVSLVPGIKADVAYCGVHPTEDSKDEIRKCPKQGCRYWEYA